MVTASADEDGEDGDDGLSSSAAAAASLTMHQQHPLPVATVANGDEEPNTMIAVEQQRQDRMRLGLFISSCLCTFLFVGAFMGWGPMQLLLEENGTFHQKCDDYEGEDEVCPAQTAALLNVTLIAQLTIVTSPFLGWILDKYTARRAAYFMSCCALTGLALVVVAVAYSPDYDWLLYVGFSFVSLQTWIGGLLTVQTGLYFAREVTRTRVIVCLNSLFDSAAITYLGLWSLYDSSIVDNLNTVFVLYFGLAVVIFGSACYFWTVAVPQQQQPITSNNSSSVEESSRRSIGANGHDKICKEIVQPAESIHSETYHLSSTQSSKKIVTDGLNAAADEQSSTNDKYEEVVPPLPESADRSAPKADQIAVPSSDGGDRPRRYIPVAERTPRQQVLSIPFLLVTIFWSIHMCSNIFMLITARDFLKHLGDDEVGNKYLTIFTLLTPASVVGVPFVDHVTVHYGFGGAFQVINLLALGYSLVKVSSTDLNVQVVGFVIFSFFRCFVFGTTFSFLPTLFSVKSVGMATGLLYALGGIASFINIPLANVAVEKLDGDFFVPNLLYTILVLPCIAVAWGLDRIIKLEKAAKMESSTAAIDNGARSSSQRMMRRSDSSGASSEAACRYSDFSAQAAED